MRVSGVRARVLLCLLLIAASVTSVFQFDTASAAQITTRSLTLEKNGSVVTGGSAPSAVGGAGTVGTANHHFTFTVPTTSGIQSARFQYCTTAGTGTCTTPTDLVTTSATLGTVTGLTGSSLTNSTNGSPYVAFSAISSTVNVTLNAVKNPSAVNTTFYVRMTTYTSNNATTGATDTGTVAASTTQTITVTGTMPEYLAFCTGEAVGNNGGGNPDCANATGGAVAFNQLFSPSSTAFATSQMAASTNAGSGYVIVVTGTTLTSGSNTIAQIGTTAATAAATLGTSKFGLNLVDNATPDVGINISPTSNTTNLRGLAATGYGTADQFALDLTGATPIARSDNNTPGSPAPTDLQRYTVSYIANVSGSQAPGDYTATLNFVCTPTF